MNVFIDILLLQYYNITLITSFKLEKERKRKKEWRRKILREYFQLDYIFLQ